MPKKISAFVLLLSFMSSFVRASDLKLLVRSQQVSNSDSSSITSSAILEEPIRELLEQKEAGSQPIVLEETRADSLGGKEVKTVATTVMDEGLYANGKSVGYSSSGKKGMEINKHFKENQKKTDEFPQYECNQDLLQSYLFGYRSYETITTAKKPNMFFKELCPFMTSTCCSEYAFQELANSYFETKKKVKGFEIVLSTLFDTVLQIPPQKFEKFAFGLDLKNNLECANIRDVNEFSKLLAKLKDETEFVRKIANKFFQITYSYYAGFPCQFCDGSFSAFVEMKSTSSIRSSITVTLDRSTCVYSLENEIRMQEIRKYYIGAWKIYKAIKCTNENPEDRNVSEIKFEQQFFDKKLAEWEECLAQLKNPSEELSKRCFSICDEKAEILNFYIKEDISKHLIALIRELKKRFKLDILAPNDMLAQEILQRQYIFYPKASESKYNLDNYYTIVFKNDEGVNLLNHRMNVEKLEKNSGFKMIITAFCVCLLIFLI